MSIYANRKSKATNMEEFQTKSVIEALERINTNLESTNSKLGNIENLLSGKTERKIWEETLETAPLDIATLLSLPDHLRKTAMAITKLGKATAEDVAAETGRTRAIESSYLNTLIRMGHAKKKRVSKKVVFCVE